MDYKKKNRSIFADNLLIFEDVSESIGIVSDETKSGIFLRAETSKKCQFWSISLGLIASLDRFAACYRREETFWMFPCVGKSISEIPADTQWLLVRRTDNLYVVLVPIFDNKLRFSLDGRSGKICMWADTGNPWVIQNAGIGVFLAVGEDLYTLQEKAAAAIALYLKTVKLRYNKPVPDFIDFFGWCTWNAFYLDISEEKILCGLESFKKGGISLKFLILDDGWLSTKEMPYGGQRLVSFYPNEKFPSGLKNLIQKVKNEYKIRFFLIWHAIMGYWAGVDGENFPEYDAREVVRQDPSIYGRNMAQMFSWMGTICGVIPEGKVKKFYEDFHSFLAEQGVDGVKVDNQSSLELSVAGLGDRVGLSMAYRKAIETSCNKYFSGRLINCMSNANDMILMADNSNLWRTSTDFWPDHPETHGLHLYTNSLVGLFFGHFVYPDWDMFESGHPVGEYHAAGRAISGSLVYVSDRPGTQNFNVLKKLVCRDGTVLRCKDIGRPAPECIFYDPTCEDILLKIFNFNQHNAVLGVFHAKYKGQPISGTISLNDIPGLRAGRYAVFAHRSGEVFTMDEDATEEISLRQGEWEIFTFSEIKNGMAVLGLADKYNSGGAITRLEHMNRCIKFCIRDAGTLVLYAEHPAVSVRINGESAGTGYVAENKKILVQVPLAGSITITW